MGSLLVLDCRAPCRQANSQLSLLLHRAIQRQHDECENIEITRLDKLGGWGGNAGSIQQLCAPG